MGFLTGKRALIVGIASQRSIASGIAEAMHREGAELAFTYQNERFLDRITKFAAEFDSTLVFPCDVADDAHTEFLEPARKRVLVGLLVLSYLKDGVHQATWLNDEEKALITRELAEDDQQKVTHASVGEFIRDRRLWLLAAIYFCVVMGQYAITFWLPTLVRNAGVSDPLHIGFLTSLPYLCAIAAMLLASGCQKATEPVQVNIAALNDFHGNLLPPAGGIKPGITWGSTDELGYRSVEDIVDVHDLHATMLHLVGIERLHLEQDAGKSIHDQHPNMSFVDLNRSGVALMEIVSRPDLRSADEAKAYVTKLRTILRYLGTCDGNMEEGSLRCDANVSVRLIGAPDFGTKVEVKNMNSIRNVQRAIEFEVQRQIECIENGEIISQETRSFDALKGITIYMRSKEAANDYRYFPEPDLLPLIMDDKQIALIRSEMPALPRELFKKYTEELGLSAYDAYNLTDNKGIALFYEDVIKHTRNYKAAANWIMGDVKSYLNEFGVEIEDFPISDERLADLIKLIDEGKVSSTVASQKIFPGMLTELDKSPLHIAEKLNLIQVIVLNFGKIIVTTRL